MFMNNKNQKPSTEEKRRAVRSFYWSTAYYLLLVLSVIYLMGKESIINAEVLLVFIPLILLVLSTETMSKKFKDEQINLQPFALIDFIAKLGAFIFAQILYRFSDVGIALTISMWVLLCIVAVVSFAMGIKMLLIANKRIKTNIVNLEIKQ